MSVSLSMLSAFRKLGLDCAKWTEPVYADLTRYVSSHSFLFSGKVLHSLLLQVHFPKRFPYIGFSYIKAVSRVIYFELCYQSFLFWYALNCFFVYVIINYKSASCFWVYDYIYILKLICWTSLGLFKSFFSGRLVATKKGCWSYFSTGYVSY